MAPLRLSVDPSMKRSALAFLLLFALPLGAQEPPRFAEEIDVDVVLLDAIVTDSRGNQILGLGKDDFIVKENGTEQPIESVEYFTNRQLLNAREEKAPFKVEQVREERYFVFFFDKPAEAEMFDRIVLARQGAKDFVDRWMKPGDRVAVAGHDVRLKLYTDFTSDRNRIKAALDEVARFGRGITTAAGAPPGSILSAIDMSRMIDQTGNVYEALETLADALRPIRGRKNLILFSAGIFEPGEVIRGDLVVSESTYYRPMIRALNQANVSVFAVSLWSQPAVSPLVHQTLSRIASETNGEYFQFAVSYGPLLKRIEQINSGYYLISYRSRHRRGTSGWQKVELDVRNQPQLRVKAREGYAYGD